MKIKTLCAYFPLFGWFFPMFVWKGCANDDFCQFHVRQGLGASFAFMSALSIIWFIGNAIPAFMDFFLYGLYIAAVCAYAYLLFRGISALHSGERKPLPWIGAWSEKLPV